MQLCVTPVVVMAAPVLVPMLEVAGTDLVDLPDPPKFLVEIVKGGWEDASCMILRLTLITKVILWVLDE
jgi:hypothetical protein